MTHITSIASCDAKNQIATIGRGGFGFVRACKAKKGGKEALVTKVSFDVVGISIVIAIAWYRYTCCLVFLLQGIGIARQRRGAKKLLLPRKALTLVLDQYYWYCKA